MMNKKIKSIIGTALLTGALVLSSICPAFAATISTKSDDTHTYEVFQIFTGDLSADGTTLSNVQAGSSYAGDDSEDGIKAALAALEAKLSDTDFSDPAQLAVIEQYVDLTKPMTGNVTKTSSKEVPEGYYLIKDVDDSIDGTDAYTLYITAIANDIEITRKVAVPTVTKTVTEKNDTAGTTTTGQVAADYDIGDTVAFEIVGTLPENYADYTHGYEYIFHDTLAAGLTFNNDVVIKADGNTVTDKFTVTASGTAITISCDDLTEIDGLTKDSEIVVTYTATLNANAVKGSAGNSNSVVLEFSNNPNTDKNEVTAETPASTVKVYTYQLKINKADKDGALNGAGFTLYKKVGADYVAVGDEIFNASSAVFTWDGIDAGSYKLVETTTPDGYNTVKDITFDVTSTMTDADLTDLVAANIVDADGATAGDNAITANVSTGIIEGTVVNVKGSLLPTTGATGLLILIVCAGVVLVFGAGMRIKSSREDA